MSSQPDEGTRPHQFHLFREGRFGPFFWTVFMGAVNDNLLKFAVVLLLTYQLPLPWLPAASVGAVLGGLFMLPSLLLSAWMGQWADKLDLARLMRWGKTAECLMMLLAAWALWQGASVLLLVCVLLSGVHVSLFATVKYAYLPRHLAGHELTGGNGLLEMGTFTAVLLGTIAGGVLMAHARSGLIALMLVLLGLALLGRWRVQAVPATPAPAPGLRLAWNPMAITWQTLAHLQGQPRLSLSLLGISWMWFFAAVFFSLFPALAHTVLHAREDVASLLLVVSSVGVAAGALACERLSRAHAGDAPGLGLVLPGALGMAVFGGDMARVVATITHDPTMAQLAAYGLRTWLSHPLHWWGVVDLLGMCFSIGVFSVPLYAQMQWQADPGHRARIVAANNILNALFILLSALMTWALSAAGWPIWGVLLAGVGLHMVTTVTSAWRFPWLRAEAVALLRRWRTVLPE